MELLHLTTLHAIVRHGTFRRAAQALNYSQSAVTAHVKQLERDLDVSLFTRRAKRVALTEAGRVLAEQGGWLLERASLLRQLMSNLAAGTPGMCVWAPSNPSRVSGSRHSSHGSADRDRA